MGLLLFCFLTSYSQVKIMKAIKTVQPPLIDGLLDDAAWLTSPVATEFIQNFPSVGKPATQRTEVRVLYNDEYIYIGAKLFDDPALIRGQITARDEEQQQDLDYFSVFLDTYHDRQNGFQFLVTSSNVQTDARMAPNLDLDDGDYGDRTWDAVWDSKTAIVSDGWNVEMKIPYLSLRFAKKDVQDWGLQFLRLVRRNNERSFWNPVDPRINGFVNQFGLLSQLTEIRPPLRLSFSPYLSSGYRNTPEASGNKNEWLKSGGMDVKYGINESFTLDVTLIPDFGQVVSDNVVNNLTPYEVKFDEYRPFFTEGTEIFNKSGLFYSRRIGASPAGYNLIRNLPYVDPDIEIIRNPGRTQLINAVKLSGRTSGKLGIGVFNALGAPMNASYLQKSTGQVTHLQTEPLTNYNIFVLDQALKHRSYLTFTNTNVTRSGSARDANVSGLDLSLYDRTNTYNLRAYGHYSRVMNSGSNNYDGFSSMLRLGKVSGRFQYAVQNILRSVNYDPRDLGYLATANQHINTVEASWNQFTPTASFLNYRYFLTAAYHRLFRPDRFNTLVVEGGGEWTFRNFWDLAVWTGYQPDQHDYFVTGAPFNFYARRPRYGYLNLSGNTDSRKRFLLSYDLLGAKFPKQTGKNYWLIDLTGRYRFSDRFSIQFNHRYETETNYIVLNTADPVEPLVDFVDFRDVQSVLSGIYNFTPRINLTLRLRHYWSHVPVNQTTALNARGEPISVMLPNPSAPVENINFLNTDAFLTWDFRYGSRLILGYKNWIGDNQFVDGDRYRGYFRNLGQTASLRYGNEMTVRFIYFLDYNQLKRH